MVQIGKEAQETIDNLSSVISWNNGLWKLIAKVYNRNDQYF